MSALDYPRLRPVEAFPVSVENDTRIYLRDPQNYAAELLLLPPVTYFILSHFDGQHSLADIQEAFARQFSQVLPGEQMRSLIAQLDAAYYLDSDRFAASSRRRWPPSAGPRSATWPMPIPVTHRRPTSSVGR